MKAIIFKPAKAWIENLREGDLAPDCFGRLAEVVRVSYRGTDTLGREFVGVDLLFGERGTISDSYKAGRIHRSVPLCNRYTSAELDALERHAPERSDMFLGDHGDDLVELEV